MEKQTTFPAKVRSAGKSDIVTVPKEARDILGIETGDFVEIIIRKVEIAKSNKGLKFSLDNAPYSEYTYVTQIRGEI